MNVMPLYLIDMRVQPAGRRAFRLWLPLFLLWPLLLVLGVLALVLTILADLVLAVLGQKYHHYTLLLLGAFSTINEARGTTVHVTGDDDTLVDMTFK